MTPIQLVCPNPLLRRRRALVLVGGALLLALVVLVLLHPADALAVLRSAAEDQAPDKPAGQGGGTIAQVSDYVDKISSFLVWLAIPGATLGILVAGGMFMVGNRKAAQVGAGVIVGLIVVVCSKGIAA